MSELGFSLCGGLDVRVIFIWGCFGGVFGGLIAFLCNFSIFCEGFFRCLDIFQLSSFHNFSIKQDDDSNFYP